MHLDTERLLIRPFTHDDRDAVITMFADPDFTAWSQDGILSTDQALAKLDGFVAMYAEHGYAKLALTVKATGNVVGYCGFGRALIDGRQEPELGYRLLPAARGRGLVTEAARAIINDAFTRRDQAYVLALIRADNMPSRSVAERLGMTSDRNATVGRNAYMLYRLDRPA